MKHDFVPLPGLHTSRPIGRSPKGQTIQIGRHYRLDQQVQPVRQPTTVHAITLGPAGLVDRDAEVRTHVNRATPDEQRKRREREDVGFAFSKRGWARL